MSQKIDYDQFKFNNETITIDVEIEIINKKIISKANSCGKTYYGVPYADIETAVNFISSKLKILNKSDNLAFSSTYTFDCICNDIKYKLNCDINVLHDPFSIEKFCEKHLFNYYDAKILITSYLQHYQIKISDLKKFFINSAENEDEKT